MLETPLPALVRIVEDEPAIVALFRQLGQTSGFEVEAYETKGEFLANFDPTRTGCLVLDQNLPDGTGLEILEQLAQRDCHMPVVFMSGMAKVSEAVTALRLGSLDFVEKPFDLETMLAAIVSAVRTDIERRADSAQLEALTRRFARLTPREHEVMEFVVRGSPNKEIAANLGLSPKTVEVHRANVMRKTEANSVAELVRMHVALKPS